MGKLEESNIGSRQRGMLAVLAPVKARLCGKAETRSLKRQVDRTTTAWVTAQATGSSKVKVRPASPKEEMAISPRPKWRG